MLFLLKKKRKRESNPDNFFPIQHRAGRALLSVKEQPHVKPAAFSKDRFKIKIKQVLLKSLMFECFGEGDQFWQPRGFNPKTHRRIMRTS